jgi:hypothetical protein
MERDLSIAVSRFFKGYGGRVEVRVLGLERPKVFYPKSAGELSRLVEEYDGRAGIYFSVNAVKEGLAVKGCRDKDMEIRALLIDVDPEHPVGSMAAATEKAEAWATGMRIKHFLEEAGIVGCPVMDSGNGVHIYVWISTPNDSLHTGQRRQVLKFLAGKFDTEFAAVDPTTYNASRIARLPGTQNVKGENTPERPWRKCKVVEEGQAWDAETGRQNWQRLLEVTGQKMLPAELPEEGQESPRRAVASRDLQRSVAYVQKTLARGDMEYRQESYGDGVIFRLQRCPWEECHSTESQAFHDGAVLVSAEGVITYHCVHRHCVSRTWADVKDWCNRPIVKECDFARGTDHFITLDSYYSTAGETPFGDAMLTGYRWLDETLKGLQRGEVTLIAGETSCGKTAFGVSLALNLIGQGYRVAYISNEMTMNQLGGRFLLSESHSEERAEGPSGGWYVPANYRGAVLERLQGKLIIYKGSTDGDEILRSLCGLGSVDAIILDNLASTGLDENTLYTAQKMFVQRLSESAKALNAHILLLAHVKKTYERLARLSDVFGSSNISNLVDNVILIHRGDNDGHSNDFRKKMIEQFKNESGLPLPLTYDTYLEVVKNRDWGLRRWIGLTFDKERGRVVDPEEGKPAGSGE